MWRMFGHSGKFGLAGAWEKGVPDLKGTNEGGGYKVGAFSHAFKRLQKFCSYCGSYKESQAEKKYCDRVFRKITLAVRTGLGEIVLEGLINC